MNIANAHEVNELIEKLFKCILGPIEKHRTMVQDAKQYIAKFPTPFEFKSNEKTIVEKITEYLRFKTPNTQLLGASAYSSYFSLRNQATTNYYQEFVENYENLKKTNMTQEHRSALLTFLLSLADKNINKDVYPRRLTKRPPELAFNLGISNVFQLVQRDCLLNPSKPNTILFERPTERKKEYKTQNLTKNITKHFGEATVSVNSNSSKSMSPRSNFSYAATQESFECDIDAFHFSASNARPVCEMDQIYVNSLNTTMSDDVSRCIIYSFTGVDGLYLEKHQKPDIGSTSFELTAEAHNLNSIQAGMILRLAELGNYHDELKPYTDVNNILSAKGLMGQGLVISLQNKLTAYYGMVADLQESMRDTKSTMTLMDILSWSIDVENYLHWLVAIAKKCEAQKGSAVATTLFSFLNNGSKSAKHSAKELLIAVCGSLYQMLKRWVLDGELFDPYDEFFIGCNQNANPKEFWNEKYYIRPEMLPSFLTMDFADKILVTGKSINFLRELCNSSQIFNGSDELETCIKNNPEYIFNVESDTQFHSIIKRIYFNASNQLLEVISGQYKLGLHLQAMRQYLLLGMGDFVNTLMERLKFEIDQPSFQINYYVIVDVLDAAVRTSNAQFDDAEILNNLDIRFLVSDLNEPGWNILSLQYKIKGPLTSLLESSSEDYQNLFKPLWRLKHMEFVISSCIWRDQLLNAKQLRSMAHEINFVQYRLYLHTAELMHFIHQLTYYILFEVIECSWVTLQSHLKNAKTLDDVLKPHNNFLKKVREGVFLTPECLSHQLESVYDCIERLEKWQEAFYNCCFKELESRRKYHKMMSSYSNDSEFSSERVNNCENLRAHTRKEFELTIDSSRTSLENIANGYGNAVHLFLQTLNKQSDQSLQLLAVRLNFNEFYKRKHKH